MGLPLSDVIGFPRLGSLVRGAISLPLPATWARCPVRPPMPATGRRTAPDCAVLGRGELWCAGSISYA